MIIIMVFIALYFSVFTLFFFSQQLNNIFILKTERGKTKLCFHNFKIAIFTFSIYFGITFFSVWKYFPGEGEIITLINTKTTQKIPTGKTKTTILKKGLDYKKMMPFFIIKNGSDLVVLYYYEIYEIMDYSKKEMDKEMEIRQAKEKEQKIIQQYLKELK